jgi:hypothetical protein
MRSAEKREMPAASTNDFAGPSSVFYMRSETNWVLWQTNN